MTRRGLTAKEYMDSLSPGDPVEVLDTSNNRIREAAVRRVIGVRGQVKGVDVYVLRFRRVFELDHEGKTNLGRFKLVIP